MKIRVSVVRIRPWAPFPSLQAPFFLIHRDHLASVRAVTDASGQLVEGTGYAAIGETLNTGFQTQKSYIPSRHLLHNCLPGNGRARRSR